MVGDQQMLIDGEWCEPADGRRLPIINPATGREIGTIPDAGAADVDRAVRAAAAAFAEGQGHWASRLVSERQAILGRVLDRLAARADEIGALECADGGFTIRNAVGFHGHGAPMFVREAIAHAPSDVPQGMPLAESPVMAANFIRREPVGVVAAMPASNGGYFMGLVKTMSALVTGNSVVLKPSPLCSASSVEIAKAIVAEPEIPAGVFQLVQGDHEAGAALTAHPLVNKITFTGSAATARRIMAAAAPNLSRLTFELGGKGPVIVCEDADLDVAVDGIVWGVMWQSGQVCIAGSRLLVPSSLRRELVARLSARLATIVIGDPLEPDTDFGPVVSEAARDRIEGYVARATEAGARVVCGGTRPDIPGGYWVTPTLLDGVTPDMTVAREEIFGPVLAVMTYDDLDHAVEIANDTEYGLSATVWSGDYPQAIGLAKRLRAGTVWINDQHMMSPSLPFGGYKHSGIGREFGLAGIEAFTEIKNIHVDLTGSVPNPVWGVLLGHNQ
jgi:aldehyde dehydrogenase (NAD+)